MEPFPQWISNAAPSTLPDAEDLSTVCRHSAAADRHLPLQPATLGGEALADRLLEEFHELFEAISTGDEPGRLIQAEYDVTGRYVRCGKHFAYWKALASGEIGIAEILHERMNLGDHLAGSVALNEPRDE